MKDRIIRNGVCAITVLGLAACAGNVAQSEDEPVEATGAASALVIVEAQIAGGKAQFIELDPETLLITTNTTGVSKPLRDPELRGLDAAQIYQHWSGEAAPARLVELVAKVTKNSAAMREDSGRVVGTSAALSSEEFQAMHCGGEQYCWLNKTGTWENEERARYWNGWVDAARGNVSIQMRRHQAFGGWTPVWSADVLEGQTQDFYATSDVLNRRPLKFKIFNADGDRWHFAGTWL
jgi:hypothetical protein